MTDNNAAERLREELGVRGDPLVDAALDAERRATVERIRAEVLALEVLDPENRARTLRILDEEAER